MYSNGVFATTQFIIINFNLPSRFLFIYLTIPSVLFKDCDRMDDTKNDNIICAAAVMQTKNYNPYLEHECRLTQPSVKRFLPLVLLLCRNMRSKCFSFIHDRKCVHKGCHESWVILHMVQTLAAGCDLRPRYLKYVETETDVYHKVWAFCKFSWHKSTLKHFHYSCMFKLILSESIGVLVKDTSIFCVSIMLNRF